MRIVNRDRKTTGDYIDMSDGVRKSNSTINIKNHDKRCLEYCIIASREYKNVSVNGKSNQKVYQKYFKILIIPENQQYPINLEEFIDVKKYEELNNICINIYVIRNKMFIQNINQNIDMKRKLIY